MIRPAAIPAPGSTGAGVLAMRTLLGLKSSRPPRGEKLMTTLLTTSDEMVKVLRDAMGRYQQGG
jgi:hypothetical protein